MKTLKVFATARKHFSLVNVKLAIIIGLVLFSFLFSLDIIASSVQNLHPSIANTVLNVTSNPFISLFIGLLLTAIIQSSSTCTSMVVALVGTGALTLNNAIPMVMGANIGTTITSTVVSLGFITSKNEFRKAISAGAIHDVFNITVVLILFPLEYYYNLLSNASKFFASLFVSTFGSGRGNEAVSTLFSINPMTGLSESLEINNVVLLITGFFILLFTIKLISKIIYSTVIGESRKMLMDYIFQNPFKSFAWGGVLTATIQSSSVTTPLIVPLVATGRVQLYHAFPFIVGANIGTTLTALLAAAFKTEAAMSIAMAHFLFNLFGTVLFLAHSRIRKIPVNLAGLFGQLTMQNRIYGFLYIITVFFLLPFLLIYLSNYVF